MPFLKKFLLHTTYYIILTTILSGCSAIGTNKPAALQVTTTPEASIFLDGKHLGKTPFYSDQLKSGNHELKITASEANFSTKINLTASTLTVVNRQLADNFLAQSGEILSLTQGKKSLIVTSQPASATLTIDGKSEGQTPIIVNNLAEADHKVELSHDGYVTHQFAIKIVNGYQLAADVTLSSESAKGVAAATPTPLPEVKKVEILKTPQGFLRVRKDASVNSTELGRVKDGDQFEITQESEGWVKISFQGKDGWISTQYTKKL